MTDLFKGDAFGPLDGAHEPCVLSESVSVSHGKNGFLGKNMKK